MLAIKGASCLVSRKCFRAVKIPLFQGMTFRRMSGTTHSCNATGVCGCKCSSCGEHLGKCTLFCPSCTIIQRLDNKACNFFELFGFPNRYDIDPNAIDGAFKKLQWMLHPDKFSLKSADEQQTSTHNSSVVNEGYSSLKCPLSRANSLLLQHGIDALNQSKASSNPALMMEIFELREEIDELLEIGDMKSKLESLVKQKEAIEGELNKLFGEHKYQAAADLVVKLQYLMKVIDELDRKCHKEEFA